MAGSILAGFWPDCYFSRSVGRCPIFLTLNKVVNLPSGHLTIVAGRLFGHRPISSSNDQIVGRCPAGARRSPAGHRRDIDQQFGHLRMKSADGRTVSRRRSSGDHWVSLRLCSRSRKSGCDQRISKNSSPAKIRPKSSGHRSIYVVL